MAVAQVERPKARTKKRKKKLPWPAEPVVRLYALDEKRDIEVPTDLPEDDGEPLESNWHRAEINRVYSKSVKGCFTIHDDQAVGV